MAAVPEFPVEGSQGHQLRESNLREFYETTGIDPIEWVGNGPEVSFLPKTEEASEGPKPYYFRHFPDSQTGLSQDVIAFTEPGLRVDLSLPKFIDLEGANLPRFHISTRSGNEYLLNGTTMWDMRASEEAGRPTAVEFDARADLPTVTIGKTKISTPEGDGDVIEKIEQTVGLPTDNPDDEGRFESLRDDPFAKVDRRLDELETSYANYLQENPSKIKKIGRFLGKISAGAVAVVSKGATSISEKAKSIDNKRALKTLGVVAVAAGVALGTVEVQDQLTQGRGNNRIVPQPKPKLPAKIRANGRDPWNISAVLLGMKYQVLPTNPKIDEADQKILELNGIDQTTGEDRRLPDDFVYKVPGDL